MDSPRRFKFLGRGGDDPYYGDGVFMRGKIYTAVGFDLPGRNRDVRLLDEEGDAVWEELQYFKEVT